MPHKQSQYLFDYCPKCRSVTGSVVLKQWKKPLGVYLKVEDVRQLTMNQRRHLSGLPPLDDKELVELNELNLQIINEGRRVVAHWAAAVSILPQLLRKYPETFQPAELAHTFRVHADFMESINDESPKKIDWGRWFKIADFWKLYGSYRGASKKSRFQSWDKVWHEVSPKYIKQKLPEVLKFQEEVKNTKYNPAKFLLSVGLVLRNDPELRERYNVAYERTLQQQKTMINTDKRSDMHRYYVIRHKLEKGRKECGPFKEGEIPGLAMRLPSVPNLPTAA